MIYSTMSGPLPTDMPVELEHVLDRKMGDEYECVTLHINGIMADLGLDDAATLGTKLLMFVEQARAAAGLG